MHARGQIGHHRLGDVDSRGLGWRSFVTDNGPAMNARETVGDHAKDVIVKTGAVVVRIADDLVRRQHWGGPECRE